MSSSTGGNNQPNTSILNPIYDQVFKLVFGTNLNKDITLGLLNDVYADALKTRIEDITFVKQDPDKSSILDKTIFIDILCKTSDGEQFIVEMQKGHDPDFLKRATLYASRVYSSQMFVSRNGDEDIRISYSDMKKVRFLAISQYTLFPHIDSYFTYGPNIDINTNQVMSDEITYTYIELSKFNKTYEECTTHIDLWTYIFKNIAKTDKGIYDTIVSRQDIFSKTCNALSRGSYDEQTLLTIDKAILDYTSTINNVERRIQKGREEGMAVGREEGAKQKAIEVAENLLRINLLTVEQIADVSRLSVDEVIKIKSKI